MDTAKEKGLSEEKLKEIDAKIQEPKDLETTKYFIDLLVESITKPPEKPPAQPAEVSGQATIKSSTGLKSKTGLKLEYENPIEMGHYLYDVKGGTTLIDGKPPTEEQKQEAERMIKELWFKINPAILAGKQFKVSECPQCHALIPGDDPKAECPVCGWSIMKERKKIKLTQPVKFERM